MKKYIYSSLALFVGAIQGTLAADFTTSASGGEVTFAPEAGVDYNFYYNGTGTVGRIGGTDTYKVPYSISSATFKTGDGTTTKTPNSWNLLVDWTFDVNGYASEEKTIIKNESTGNVQLQLGSITVQNTGENATTAIIDLGEKDLYLRGNTNEQAPKFNIESDTKIIGSFKNYAVNVNSNATLHVSNNATLTLEADARVKNTATAAGLKDTNSTLTIDSGSTIFITSGKTLSVESKGIFTNNGTISGQGGKLILSNGQEIDMAGVINISQNVVKDEVTGKNVVTKSSSTISNGTKVTATNGFYTDDVTVDGENSSLTVNNFNRTNGTTTLTNGALITVNGTMTTGQGQAIYVRSGSNLIVNKCNSTNYSSLNNMVVEGTKSLFHLKASGISNRSITVYDNGIMQIDGTYTIRNNTNLKLDLDGDGVKETTKNGQIDFTQANATVIKVYNAGKIKANDIILSTAKLDLQTVNAITNANGDAINLTTDSASSRSLLTISANQTFDTITADTANLEVEITGDAVLSASFASLNGGKIFINGFAEERIFVANADKIADANTVFFAYETKDDVSTQISQLYINNGWLSAIAPAVPEPAEWAMIFGGIALGLAIYRRRK